MKKPEPVVFPMLYKHTAKEGTQEWEIWVTCRSDGAGIIHLRYGLKDGKKQESGEVINAGKNIGRSNATTPFQQAVAEAKSRWEIKKSRKGYGETVQESAAVRKVSPMLAKVYKDHTKKIDWGTAFAQPKLDGFRVLAHVCDGKVRLTSRENQPLDALVHIKKVLQQAASAHFKGDHSVIFDGEAYCHGMSLNQISSACKKKSDLSKKIQYHIYDHADTEAFEARCSFVQTFLGVCTADCLVPVETVKVRSEAELMTCQAEYLKQGYEGAMLRHSRAGYEAGKRSVSLLKVKTWVDNEFVVVDYKEGRGKFAGVPIYTCETEDGNPFEVVAPGTMEEKQELWAAREECIGKLLTVQYIYMTKTDKPVPFLPVAHAFRE